MLSKCAQFKGLPLILGSPLASLPGQRAIMTRARTGMHSLPTEIKLHIARCCADQDALLASVLKQVQTDEDDVPTNTLSPRRDALRAQSLRIGPSSP